MNVILVDDEPTMHLILRKMLAKQPGVHVTGAFTDTRSAAAFIQERAAELAFVDISMRNVRIVRLASFHFGAGAGFRLEAPAETKRSQAA